MNLINCSSVSPGSESDGSVRPCCQGSRIDGRTHTVLFGAGRVSHLIRQTFSRTILQNPKGVTVDGGMDVVTDVRLFGSIALFKGETKT